MPLTGLGTKASAPTWLREEFAVVCTIRPSNDSLLSDLGHTQMNLTKRLLPIPFLLTFSLSHAQSIRNGEDVLRTMHDRYKSSWYDTVTFIQKSTTYNPDGTNKVETWYEAALLPGKLRIDIGKPLENNGYLMVDGNVTVIKDGQVAVTRPYVNVLLVLGFDVYRQDPDATAKVLKAEGYDLTKVHEETWDGKPAYVVGAEKGDLKTKQFWIEKDNLLFVRVIEPAPSDATKIDDIRFIDYRKLAGAWIAARVEVHSEDKLVFSEDYSDIQANVKLDPGVFDPKQFNSTHWEKQ
jgi:outer membrane lipoprotein-sorting protein